MIYDGIFVMLLGFQYFNQGAKSLLMLAVKDLFKKHLGLDPGEITTYMSIMNLPWSVKLLYGMISDNVPIFGSKRKGYVILLGTIQFISLVTFFLVEITDPKVITFLLFMASLSGAYMDVIVDALMVT